MSTFTLTGHGLAVDDPLTFFDVEPSDCGVVEGQTYYVLTTPTADTFTVSETVGGAEFDLTYDLTAGSILEGGVYTPLSDAVTTPPDPIATPDPPSVSSELVSGIVRLVITFDTITEVKIRATEVQFTHKFDTNGDPDWTVALDHSVPDGTTELSIPALGLTVYNVRIRQQDVYGNFSSWSTEAEVTTVAGSDSLAAAVAALANDVSDGIITETKIANDSISTPKLKAGAVTAEILAATIVLSSLIKTADTGRRVEIDQTGITLYDSDESLLVRIPTNGDPVYVKGEVNASSLITNETAEFRAIASLAASAVMTLENGVSAPSAQPTLAASLDWLALTSTPANIGYGICYDPAGSAGGATATYWIGANPGESEYVAHEYNASTGSIIRSITKTGTFVTYTATYGSTSHISDTAEATSDNAESQIAVPIVMPRDGRITKVSIYLAGFSGAAQIRNCVWSNLGVLLDYSAGYSAAQRTFSPGNAQQYNKSLTQLSTNYNEGQTYKVGAMLVSDSDDWWWDRDDGSSKTTYLGSGENFDDFTVTETQTTHKPNVYITYEYDVDTQLEGYTGAIVGVARVGTYIWVLEDTGILYRYNQSDLTYVDKFDFSAHADFDGTKSKAGLFYDGTNIVIVTTSATGAAAKARFIKLTTAGAYSSTVTDTLLDVNGTTDTLRGGVMLADPLNSNTNTYWISVSGVVYGYVASTGANVSSRHFGSSASALDGVTHDGTVFRGWVVATPTKVWKFTGWDWTTASPIYWVGYAWYDDAGTTHETALGPRASITMRRRERLQVTTAAIPTGGADDPNKVRVYMLPNNTEPATGNYKRQVTDALTARFLSTYDSGGGADGAGTPFAAGTPAELRSASTNPEWSLTGDGRAELDLIGGGGTSFPSSPSTNDRFYRTDLGAEFFYNGTRWLSTTLYRWPVGQQHGIAVLSATQASLHGLPTPNLAGGSDIWLEDLITTFYVVGGTALSGSHKWVGQFHKRPTGNTDTTLITVNIASGSSSVWRTDVQAIDALMNNGTTHFVFAWTWTKTGTPGNLFYPAELTYRIVAT